MPGSIEVTVLEFKGVSPKPCAKSLKVSVGRRHYQTSDKGDFCFPISKLGEDLVVALLDVGGNQIAHADIWTMQIVEKGYWDEVFSMNGGGHVHLKLRFVLSDEERNRIRIMRESAVKKKLETIPNINLRLSETVSTTYETVETITKNEHKVSDSPKGFVEIDVVRPTVNNSQAGSSLALATSSAEPLTSYQKEGQRIPQSAIIPVKELSPNETDGSCQGAPYSSSKKGMQIESQVHETKPEERNENRPTASSMFLGSSTSDVAPMSRYDPSKKSLNQGPQAKNPSNVKKMISAFENSKLQEVTSLKKAPSVPSQLNRIRKDTFPTDNSLKKAPSVPSQLNRFREEQLHEDQEPKVVLHVEDESSATFKNNFPDNMQQATTTVNETEPSEAQKELKVNDSNRLSREQTVKELEKQAEDLTRQSTSAIATTSERMNEGQYQDTVCHELYSETENSYESSSVAKGSKSGKGTGLKRSSVVKFEVDMNTKRIALDEYYYSAQRSGMWTFPGHTTRLCVTTAGKQVLESVGDQHTEAETCQVNGNSSEPEVEQQQNLMHEAVYMVGNNQRKIEDQTKSRSRDSPDDSSNGLFGQVIRIAVILGFGVLVLLTRQREPRNTEKKMQFRLIPDYIGRINEALEKYLPSEKRKKPQQQ